MIDELMSINRTLSKSRRILGRVRTRPSSVLRDLTREGRAVERDGSGGLYLCVCFHKGGRFTGRRRLLGVCAFGR